MRTKIVAGNWKMNKTATEAAALVADIRQAVQDGKGTVEVVVCPPFTDLKTAAEALQGSNIGLGAQNMHWKESGAYTGEVSAAMLKDLGVKYVILGHSERRQYFAETDQTVNLKLHAALAAGLIPIVCVGETLEEREAGKMQEVIVRQVKEGLKDADLSTVVIAYEPVWAIGTGKTATPQQAQEVHALIRQTLRDMVGPVAETVRIQYGGSMKPANAKELMSQPDIDGGLIGGAALKAPDFAAIVEAGK
ncbi:MAG: triose-phosphate isomerase [Kiritimatiellia bacterium]|nr:triose-phosphate isomerase [Kiritimatiellia bacterium]